MLLRLRTWLLKLLVLILWRRRRRWRSLRLMLHWRRLVLRQRLRLWLLLHLSRAEGRSVITLDTLLRTATTRLLLLALQVQARASFAGLRHAAVLHTKGRPVTVRLRVVFRMAEGMSLEQVGAREGLGADGANVGLFIGVHTHVSAQVVEPDVRLGALAAAVKARGGGRRRAASGAGSGGGSIVVVVCAGIRGDGVLGVRVTAGERRCCDVL